MTGSDPQEAAGGGHPTYVRAHGRAALRAGFEPHIFCVSPRGGTVETDFGVIHRTRPGTGLAYVPGFKFRRHQMIWRVPLTARAVEQFVLRHGGAGPHLIHGFGIYGYAGSYVARRLLRKGVEAVPVVSAYDTLVREGQAKLRGLTAAHGSLRRLSFRAELLWNQLVVGHYERKGYAEARVVLVNYDSVRRLLLESYGIAHTVRKIPYSPETAFINRAMPSGLPDGIAALTTTDAPLVVAVSRHDPRKGLDVLLCALARLRAVGVAFRACLIGAGPLLEAHRRLASRLGLDGAAAIEGPVPDSYQYLQRADVFALPSLEEGSGSLSLLEALHAGAAVVASNVDGIPEDVTDGEGALLVPPGDSAALATALERVLTDAQLRRRLACRGRQTFEARFSAAAFSTALREIYAECGVIP